MRLFGHAGRSLALFALLDAFGCFGGLAGGIDLMCFGRRSFVRGETNAVLSVRLTNASDRDFTEARLKGVEGAAPVRLARGASADFALPVETRVRCGSRDILVSAEARTADGTVFTGEKAFPVGIGSVTNDGILRLMWHSYAPPAKIADLGFTAFSNSRIGYQKLADSPEARARTDALLDEALRAGVSVIQRLQKVQIPEGADPLGFSLTNRYGRIHRRGTAGQCPPDVGRPELVEIARRLAVTNATLFGRHPALAAVLPYSELRDGSIPAFNQDARYVRETGRTVPRQIANRWIMNAEFARKRFPNGIVPEDDPFLAYYRWFWSGGDGWPDFLRESIGAYVGAGVHDGFFSLWDPGVRCPPRWGSGGSADMLGQWVYPNPEPMAVAGVAEGLAAMAEGCPGQKIGLMTQIVCYRRQVAPTNEVVSPMPAWTREKGADYMPPLSPDMLQEAVWAMISKPVAGISFFGWCAVDEKDPLSTPELRERMRHLMRDVVAPLGPTLKRLGRTRSRAAVLDSFTSCIMGCTAGWGWTAPPVTFAQRARLDPRVVYEETVMRDGLGDVKVLYAPECRYLPADVVRRIADFQAKGGVLVADTNLVAALKADVIVPVVSFVRPPAFDSAESVDENETAQSASGKNHENTLRLKRHMTKAAEALRRELARSYVPPADSSSPDIVVFGRRGDETDYVFALNDRRTFGDWFGPWGLVMDKGLALVGSVTQSDPDGRVVAVYELSRGGEVAFAREDGRVRVPVSFETNDGRLFAFLKQKIARLDVSAPESVVRGQTFEVTASVLDGAGDPVRALLPVEVRLVGPDGREMDGGWRCAEGGCWRGRFLVNVDEPAGSCRIVLRDRASGLQVSRLILSR